MDKSWPFDQPPNCAVLSLRTIVESNAPILLVSHDEDDHGWQFLDGSAQPDEDDAVMVCFSHLVESDPTLYELSDLPPGWIAWRLSTSDNWERAESSSSETE